MQCSHGVYTDMFVNIHVCRYICHTLCGQVGMYSKALLCRFVGTFTLYTVVSVSDSAGPVPVCVANFCW